MPRPTCEHDPLAKLIAGAWPLSIIPAEDRALPSWIICTLRLSDGEVASICVGPPVATISAATLIADPSGLPAA
jgi:hypothetical protein